MQITSKIFFRSSSPPSPKKSNVEISKNRLFRKKLKKFWRFRNFCDPEVAEISVDRVAPFKVTNFRILNPGKFLAKLAKLRSSEVMSLLDKSIMFEPPGGYLLYNILVSYTYSIHTKIIVYNWYVIIYQ